MIREFHDEITRLRQELASFSGGKINFDPASGTMSTQGDSVTVARTELVVD